MPGPESDRYGTSVQQILGNRSVFKLHTDIGFLQKNTPLPVQIIRLGIILAEMRPSGLFSEQAATKNHLANRHGIFHLQFFQNLLRIFRLNPREVLIPHFGHGFQRLDQSVFVSNDSTLIPENFPDRFAEGLRFQAARRSSFPFGPIFPGPPTLCAQV
jgi:hypothetical protein